MSPIIDIVWERMCFVTFVRNGDKDGTMKSIKLAFCLLTLSLLAAGCAKTEQGADFEKVN